MLFKVREATVLERAGQAVQAGTAVNYLGIHTPGWSRDLWHLCQSRAGQNAAYLSQQTCGILTHLSRVRRFLTEEAIKLLVKALVL